MGVCNHVDSRVRQVLVLMPRFDREFVMTFQRQGYSQFNFVFNEGPCLISQTSPE